jgi:4-hydroxybutyrate CoA-transferase
MDWKTLYRNRKCSIAEAAGFVKSGDRVVAANFGGTPEGLMDGLVARSGELRNVEIMHMVSMGKCDYMEPSYEGIFRHNSLFAGASSRSPIWEGRGDYTPCFFHEIPRLFREKIVPVDVAMITASPPDRMGNVSLGIAVDYSIQACLSARTVIAEITEHMPFTGGSSCLHVSQIDHFVCTDRPLMTLDPPAVGDVESRIGAHVASLIRDGDCLQLGIGAIPDAVLSFLKEKNDLGIHSEMISDGVASLVEKGVITGRQKTLHPNKIVISFAMGTNQFYQWLGQNSMVEVYPVDYVNDPYVVAKNHNQVSINSALTVDLLGQVAADMLGPRQFSGIGGQVDFVRGARRSPGGRSIIAIPATAAKGTASRIVTTLEPGQAVSTSRNDVDYVATEFGIAYLTGKTLEARARAIIDIAAPQFHDELLAEGRRIFNWLN